MKSELLKKINKSIKEENFFIKHYEKMASFGIAERLYFEKYIFIHEKQLVLLRELKELANKKISK